MKLYENDINRNRTAINLYIYINILSTQVNIKKYNTTIIVQHDTSRCYNNFIVYIFIYFFSFFFFIEVRKYDQVIVEVLL